MHIEIQALFETEECRDRFMQILDFGGFKVKHAGEDVYCVYDGDVSGSVLRQIPLAVECEREDVRRGVARRCLEASDLEAATS